jgi:hypothetical protein
MKYFTIPNIKTILGQREVSMQIKAVPLTDVELPREGFSTKFFGQFPSQDDINDSQADDPGWKKKCSIEVDENLQQLDLTPIVQCYLVKPNVSSTVYLEDLDIKLMVEYFDSLTTTTKSMEVPPGLDTNYFWEVYSASQQVGQRYTTTFYLKTKHYDPTKGIVMFMEGTTAPISPVTRSWRVSVSVKKSISRQFSFNTLLSSLTSRSVINPLFPGRHPTTGYPNNPTFMPVTGEAVYKFLMSGLKLPAIEIHHNFGVGGDATQAPAQRFEIRTDMAFIRSKSFNFFSDREYLQYKTDSETGIGNFLYHLNTGKKIPWRVNAAGGTQPGGNGSNAALDNIYDNYELKAIKSDLPELSWTSKRPAGLMTETKVDFSKENVEYPIPEIWDNQPDTTAVLKASQTGRFKIAPYLLGHSIPDNPEDFGKYDNYYQRFDRQKYKAFFDDRDLVPKKIVEYMIKDIIADKIAIGHENEADTLQPLSNIKETYGAIKNTSPDPIVLKSFANAILNAHKTAPIIDHPNGSVTAAKLAENAVETAKIKDRNITAVKIALGTITLNELNQSVINTLSEVPDGSITNAKLASNAVTAIKITDRTITAAKIATGAITSNELASNSVITAKITDSAITAAKLAASALTANHFPTSLDLGTRVLYVPTPSL